MEDNSVLDFSVLFKLGKKCKGSVIHVYYKLVIDRFTFVECKHGTGVRMVTLYSRKKGRM